MSVVASVFAYALDWMSGADAARIDETTRGVVVCLATGAGLAVLLAVLTVTLGRQTARSTVSQGRRNSRTR